MPTSMFYLCRFCRRQRQANLPITGRDGTGGKGNYRQNGMYSEEVSKKKIMEIFFGKHILFNCYFYEFGHTLQKYIQVLYILLSFCLPTRSHGSPNIFAQNIFICSASNYNNHGYTSSGNFQISPFPVCFLLQYFCEIAFL